MQLDSFIYFTSTIWALLLAFALVFWTGRSSARWSLAIVLVLLVAEVYLIQSASEAESTEAAAGWLRVRYLVAACLPGTWLFFSLCYSRGDDRQLLVKWRGVFAFAAALPLILAVGFEQSVSFQAGQPEAGATGLFVIGWPGKVFHMGFLVFAVLILMNLEQTFRAAVGTMRWRVKFVVIGLGLLLTVRIYTSTQALLYSVAFSPMHVLNASALLLACALISVSFIRAGSFNLELYPSRALLQNSVTAVLAGIYLLIVGVFAKFMVMMGGERDFHVKSFLVLISIVALALVLASDRTQLAIRRFVSRNFRRPLHDYRQVWRNFTESANARVDESEVCQGAVNLVAETLQSMSATIWLVDEQQHRIALGASTSLVGERGKVILESEERVAGLLGMIRQQPVPVNLDESKEGWVQELKRSCPEVVGQGGGRLFVPLLAKGEILGLLTVGERVSGVPFAMEDIELLKCIGDQIAGTLLNLHLSQKLMQAREMEAFQNMAAFFVHDLKNTASSLSLVLQNLPAQFDNPEFRQDALRAVGKGVGRLNELIKRLSSLRETLQIRPVNADLNGVAAEAMDAIGPVPHARMKRLFNPIPAVMMDSEQIHKVITNLLLNAVEALGPEGEITVETGRQNGWATLSVRDNGCGMSREFVQRSLFRPFQTTKNRGLGIGMFHSKVIVEAHRGRMEVQSDPGQGTTFRLLLPLTGGTP